MESIDTVRELTKQAERDFVAEFEKENYEILNCVYEEIEKAASDCKWFVEFECDPIYEETLKLYLQLKGFGADCNIFGDIVISWYET